MELSHLIEHADDIKRRYAELNQFNSHRQWSVAEYAQGFAGDVGDLLKLILAWNHYRTIDDVDQKIAHELVDYLWSIFVIARELDVGLEVEFAKEMKRLEQRIDAELGQKSTDSV